MLKMDQVQEPAQVQVSSQEFVEAVTSIETRRQEALKRDSLPLGEAIQHLGLDLTPEEVLAEIQAQQAGQAETVELTSRQKTRKKMSMGRFLLIGSLLLNLGFIISLSTLVSTNRGASSGYAGQGFSGIMQSLNANSFDAGKLSFVKYIATTRLFSSEEVRQILLSFSFDTDRLEAATILHGHVRDPENFYHVLNTFSFDQGRQALLARIGGTPAPK